jgi:GntR family transcriptional regulator
MTTLLLKKKAIRKSGAAPIYVQVAEILDAEIKLHDDSTLSLPSEGELSREFGVSPGVEAA